MRVARSKGRRLGRKPVAVDIAAIQKLRAEGNSFELISKLTGLSVGTISACPCSKIF
jgi:DNA invertase Pin-like site-specific DNA recombinase